jgi:hypothetical protein
MHVVAESPEGLPSVAVIGLTDRFRQPSQARPRVRTHRPPGYGVREQCLPFTAAASLGITVPSPFAWGCCLPSDVPPGGRAFRSPIGPIEDGDDRVFYVIDDADFRFERNRFELRRDVVDHLGETPTPGLSFFDRADQQSMVKIHLPYGWKSPDDAVLLFVPPLNRPRADGFTILSGLVETSWYHNPVNLVGVIPSPPAPVHLAAGEPLAHVVLISSEMRKIAVDIVEPQASDTQECLDAIEAWHHAHRSDRSAYKRRSQSDQGQVAEL